MRRLLSAGGVLLLLISGCVRNVRPSREAPSGQVGLASWYGPGLQGRLTASGERFDKDRLTAAHRVFAFGTCVRVTNLGNGRQVRVRVNDRGPFVRDRIIDVSEAAAKRLGMMDKGVARVRLDGCGRSR